MDAILKPIVTPDSDFIYRDDQKFTCTDYDQLSELLSNSLFETNKDEKLMVDLTYTTSHPLMFEISLKDDTEKNTFDFLNRYVDFIFIRVLQKYISLPEITLLQAMSKSQTKGLRIYVVGVEISHDDYIELCQLMRLECEYTEEDLFAYLETPSDFPLPSSDRPTGAGDLYIPARLVRVKFGSYQENDIWYPYRQEIVTFEEAEKDSFFDQIVNHSSRWKEMVRAMMPVSQPNSTCIHFPTEIFKPTLFNDGESGGRRVIAQFKSYLDSETYHILKEKVLVKGKGFCYDFLKNYTNNINFVYSFHSPILDVWYYRFQQKKSPLGEHFWNIDSMLKRYCPHLKNESSPLTAVLSKYEKPVYFALCNLFRNEVEIDKIREQFPFLSKDLPSEPPKEASHLSFDTILYCAYLTGEGTIFNHYGVGFDWIVKNITTLPQLVRHVRKVQRNLFPIVYSLGNTHAWDPNTFTWVTLPMTYKEHNQEVKNIVRNIVELLNTYSELPTKLTDGLFDNERVMDSLVDDILIEAGNKENVEGNTITESADIFGFSVPEYYFFDLKPATN